MSQALLNSNSYSYNKQYNDDPNFMKSKENEKSQGQKTTTDVLQNAKLGNPLARETDFTMRQSSIINNFANNSTILDKPRKGEASASQVRTINKNANAKGIQNQQTSFLPSQQQTLLQNQKISTNKNQDMPPMFKKCEDAKSQDLQFEISEKLKLMYRDLHQSLSQDMIVKSMNCGLFDTNFVHNPVDYVLKSLSHEDLKELDMKGKNLSNADQKCQFATILMGKFREKLVKESILKFMFEHVKNNYLIGDPQLVYKNGIQYILNKNPHIIEDISSSLQNKDLFKNTFAKYENDFKEVAINCALNKYSDRFEYFKNTYIDEKTLKNALCKEKFEKEIKCSLNGIKPILEDGCSRIMNMFDIKDKNPITLINDSFSKNTFERIQKNLKSNGKQVSLFDIAKLVLQEVHTKILHGYVESILKRGCNKLDKDTYQKFIDTHIELFKQLKMATEKKQVQEICMAKNYMFKDFLEKVNKGMTDTKTLKNISNDNLAIGIANIARFKTFSVLPDNFVEKLEVTVAKQAILHKCEHLTQEKLINLLSDNDIADICNFVKNLDHDVEIDELVKLFEDKFDEKLTKEELASSLINLKSTLTFDSLPTNIRSEIRDAVFALAEKYNFEKKEANLISLLPQTGDLEIIANNMKALDHRPNADDVKEALLPAFEENLKRSHIQKEIKETAKGLRSVKEHNSLDSITTNVGKELKKTFSEHAEKFNIEYDEKKLINMLSDDDFENAAKSVENLNMNLRYPTIDDIKILLDKLDINLAKEEIKNELVKLSSAIRNIKDTNSFNELPQNIQKELKSAVSTLVQKYDLDIDDSTMISLLGMDDIESVAKHIEGLDHKPTIDDLKGFIETIDNKLAEHALKKTLAAMSDAIKNIKNQGSLDNIPGDLGDALRNAFSSLAEKHSLDMDEKAIIDVLTQEEFEQAAKVIENLDHQPSIDDLHILLDIVDTQLADIALKKSLSELADAVKDIKNEQSQNNLTSEIRTILRDGISKIVTDLHYKETADKIIADLDQNFIDNLAESIKNKNELVTKELAAKEILQYIENNIKSLVEDHLNKISTAVSDLKNTLSFEQLPGTLSVSLQKSANDLREKYGYQWSDREILQMLSENNSIDDAAESIKNLGYMANDNDIHKIIVDKMEASFKNVLSNAVMNLGEKIGDNDLPKGFYDSLASAIHEKSISVRYELKNIPDFIRGISINDLEEIVNNIKNNNISTNEVLKELIDIYDKRITDNVEIDLWTIARQLGQLKGIDIDSNNQNNEHDVVNNEGVDEDYDDNISEDLNASRFTVVDDGLHSQNYLPADVIKAIIEIGITYNTSVNGKQLDEKFITESSSFDLESAAMKLLENLSEQDVKQIIDELTSLKHVPSGDDFEAIILTKLRVKLALPFIQETINKFTVSPDISINEQTFNRLLGNHPNILTSLSLAKTATDVAKILNENIAFQNSISNFAKNCNIAFLIKNEPEAISAMLQTNAENNNWTELFNEPDGILKDFIAYKNLDFEGLDSAFREQLAEKINNCTDEMTLELFGTLLHDVINEYGKKTFDKMPDMFLKDRIMRFFAEQSSENEKIPDENDKFWDGIVSNVKTYLNKSRLTHSTFLDFFSPREIQPNENINDALQRREESLNSTINAYIFNGAIKDAVKIVKETANEVQKAQNMVYQRLSAIAGIPQWQLSSEAYPNLDVSAHFMQLVNQKLDSGEDVTINSISSDFEHEVNTLMEKFTTLFNDIQTLYENKTINKDIYEMWKDRILTNTNGISSAIKFSDIVTACASFEKRDIDTFVNAIKNNDVQKILPAFESLIDTLTSLHPDWKENIAHSTFIQRIVAEYLVDQDQSLNSVAINDNVFTTLQNAANTNKTAEILNKVFEVHDNSRIAAMFTQNNLDEVESKFGSIFNSAVSFIKDSFGRCSIENISDLSSEQRELLASKIRQHQVNSQQSSKMTSESMQTIFKDFLLENERNVTISNTLDAYWQELLGNNPERFKNIPDIKNFAKNEQTSLLQAFKKIFYKNNPSVMNTLNTAQTYAESEEILKNTSDIQRLLYTNVISQCISINSVLEELYADVQKKIPDYTPEEIISTDIFKELTK
ncbi:MAG: hypothetical protein IJU37_07500, partial [Desulfovibrio sp.]|nr:hypothetical protein [Desulfovibrio sp.]